MKIYIKIVIFGLLIFSSQSCTNLDVIPQDDDEFLSEDFYSSPEAYKQALAGVYGNFALTGSSGATSSNLQGIDAGTSQYMRTLWYLQELSTDEPIWSYEGDDGVATIQRNTWNASNPFVLGFFSRALLGVSLTNEYLRQTTDDKIAERGHTQAVAGDIKAFRAEARLLRALNYYNLLDLYGKAPFNSENDAVNTQGPEYNSQQLFDFIESELLAIEPDLVAARGNEYGRADKAVAWMILAKLYLNANIYIGQDKNTECLTYLNKIINSGYSLASNYSLNFLADNDSNEAAQKEIIFEIESDGDVTENYGATTVIINGEVGSIEENGADLGVNGWGGALRVRKQFALMWNTVPSSDTRNTMITQDRSIDIFDIADKDTGYIITKFKNVSSTGVAGSDNTYVDTDFPMFRLGDVYLMYAEAVLRGGTGGTAGQALNYVNMLRSRANSSAIGTSDLTLDFILDERSRELYWEGHRRQDLIRFGKFTGGSYIWAWKGNSPNGLAIPSYMKVYPIPSNSLATNPNLTQNEGY